MQLFWLMLFSPQGEKNPWIHYITEEIEKFRGISLKLYCKTNTYIRSQPIETMMFLFGASWGPWICDSWGTEFSHTFTHDIMGKQKCPMNEGISNANCWVTIQVQQTEDQRGLGLGAVWGSVGCGGEGGDGVRGPGTAMLGGADLTSQGLRRRCGQWRRWNQIYILERSFL